jgi:uncharacterized protein (TIGR02246 family)
MSDEELSALAAEFGQAWNDHDLERALELVTDDCVFESTGPAPDGERATGRDAVRAAWKPIFDDARSRFDTEDMILAGDRIVSTWRYTWGDGSIRGVDVMRARDGRIAEKFSYVKG